LFAVAVADASDERLKSSRLFWLARESLEDEFEGMMGRPVILLDETPAGNCFIRVPSSAGGESGDSSGSAIETTGLN
jgi:hypothetical protein